ncbi:uncharacterized protein LOC128553259 [Mercenaria mercenaria]|uniref:uncharacterized protein LOC128553259 n=1 Tax=Mercenaria mercenaria TaxID=6596 RepID=UPI00234E3FC4|nr:uncharacterized protein LOC128553259 [Mercenaria mercenaria]
MSGSNSMSVNGTPVEAEFITPSLEKFCKWLEQFDNVILVAHNGRRFDYPVLMKAVASCKILERFLKCVSEFVDSLTVLRKHFPGRSSYKQEDLVREILRESYGAHNATEDVKALGNLLKHISVSPKTMLSFSYPPKSVRHSQLFNLEKAKNMPSLHVLVANGVCKTATAENIAGSGLNLSHLKIIFKREGEDGLRNTFVVKNSEGQPRVTNTKRTLETVIPNLVEYLKK